MKNDGFSPPYRTCPAPPPTCPDVEVQSQLQIPRLPSPGCQDHTCPSTPTPFICLRNNACAFDCCPTERSLSVAPVISNHMLQTKGQVFDRIVEVCLPMWEVLQTNEIRPCLDICGNLDVSYAPTRQNRVEVLWSDLKLQIPMSASQQTRQWQPASKTGHEPYWQANSRPMSCKQMQQGNSLKRGK